MGPLASSADPPNPSDQSDQTDPTDPTNQTLIALNLFDLSCVLEKNFLKH